MAESQGGNDVGTPRNVFDDISVLGATAPPAEEHNGAILKLTETIKQLSNSVDTLQTEVRTIKRGSESRCDLDENEHTASKRPRCESGSCHESESDSEDIVDSFMTDAGKQGGEQNEEGLLEEIYSYFEDDQETGPAVKTDLAELTNKSLRAKPKEEKHKALMQKHKRPENIDYLQVPMCNEQIWNQLKRETKLTDHLLQKAQKTYSQVLVPVIKAMEILKTESNNDLKEMVGDAFKLLSNAMSTTNKSRIERIKKDIAPMYRSICGNEPSATKLFGDRLQEQIKSIKENKSTLSVPATSSKAQSFLWK